MNHVTNILIKKPDFNSLRQAGFTLTDMHFHTNHSDSFTTIPQVLKRAAKLKINLAITDHNTISGVKAAYNNRYKVNIIPGIEVSCFEGPHILIYFSTYDELEEFYKRYIEGRQSGDPWSNTYIKTAHLLNLCLHYSCLVIAAHPFAPGYYGIENSIKSGLIHEDIMTKLHGIEAICGTNFAKNNNKAIDLIRKHEFGFTGGSDGHHISQLGDSVIATKSHLTAGILNEIKEKKNLVIGTSSPIKKLIKCGSIIAIKHAPYFRFSARFKYSNFYKKAFIKYRRKLL